MKGFGCCRHKLLTFSLRVNWNLSPGFGVFSDSQGIFFWNEWTSPPDTVGAAGKRCQMLQCVCVCVCVCQCMCVCVCSCVALVTASKAPAMGHEVFTSCLLFNFSYHHTPQSSHSMRPNHGSRRESPCDLEAPPWKCASLNSHTQVHAPVLSLYVRHDVEGDDRCE